MSSKSLPDHPSDKSEPTPLIMRAQSALKSSADVRRRLTRVGLKSVFLRNESLHLSGNRSDICSYERDRWLFNAYRAGLITKYDLLWAGKLVSDADRDDWDVGRPLPVVARQEGVKSLRDVCLMLESEGMGKSHVLEVGPGDGVTSSNLRGEIPGWTVHTYASELYFPFKKTISQFTKPIHKAELHELVQTIFLFLKREFNRSHQGLKGIVPDHANVDLNDIYSLLKILPVWIYHHYDCESGVYSVSKEFPFDTDVRMTPAVQALFSSLSPSNILQFYSSIFSRSFVVNLTLPPSDRLDLNMCPKFFPEGFIKEKFEDIHGEISRRGLSDKIDVVFGCRSDSHLPRKKYVKFVKDIVSFLPEGAFYISDGIQKSYDRRLSFRQIDRMLSNNFGRLVRSYAVVDKFTRLPVSLLVENGFADGDDFEFYSEDELSVMFNLSEVTLVPLKTFEDEIESFSQFRDLAFEDLGKNPKAFSGVHDFMEAAQVFLSGGGILSEITANTREEFVRAGFAREFDIFYDTLRDISAIRRYRTNFRKQKRVNSSNNNPRRRKR